MPCGIYEILSGKSDTWKQILGKIGHPSIHMKQMENPWIDFHEIRFWGIGVKFVNKLQVWLKYDNNNKTLHMKVYVCFCSYLEWNSLNIYWSKNRFKQKLWTKMKHICCIKYTSTSVRVFKIHCMYVKMCIFNSQQWSPGHTQRLPRYLILCNIMSYDWATIDRFWIDDQIYWTFWYSAWLHFTTHCYTHTHTHTHTDTH
jgi:hypothetical protein